MASAVAEGARDQRRGGVQSRQNGQDEAEGMETDGHEGDLRWRVLHEETREIRTLHSTHGIALQKGRAKISLFQSVSQRLSSLGLHA